jgi:hypothetical protein
MKIKMNTLAAGPAGTFPAGSVVDFPDDEARALITGGYAKAVEEPVKAPAMQVIESAVAPKPETAVMPEPAKPQKRRYKHGQS